MKKIIIFFICIIITICIIAFGYNSYKLQKNAIIQANEEFEQYTNKEIYGIDLATAINKAVDKNTKNNVEKDEKGFFIQNNENSIEIEVKIQEDEEKYTLKMEQIHNKGTEQFVQHFINYIFKCTKIEYHEKTGKIKYMIFEKI